KFGRGPIVIGNAAQAEKRGIEMGLDDPFPIEKCSGRVRGAVLAEFQGRCPTIREVASISDAQWLTVPNIGPTTLEEIRRYVSQSPAEQRHPNLPVMEDGEILSRLSRVQRELNLIASAIRTRAVPAAYK